MPEIPSMSSKDFVSLIEKAGAVFVRQGSTDHAIYARIVDGKRYSAPVLKGKIHWTRTIANGFSGS